MKTSSGTIMTLDGDVDGIGDGVGSCKQTLTVSGVYSILDTLAAYIPILSD